MLIEDFIELLNFKDAERDVKRGLYQRIARSIRTGVLSGVILPGTQLPASRYLSDALSVSRSTIVNAYEQLLSEGVIESRKGDGTYVCPAISLPPTKPIHAPEQSPPSRHFSKRAQALIKTSDSPDIGNHPLFFPGLTDLSKFPDRYWQTISNRYKHRHLGNSMSIENLGGYKPLQEAIAMHLNVARNIQCDAEQIIIMNGMLSTARFLFNLLCDPGETIMVEDPGYPIIKSAATMMGLDIQPLPVDEKGAVIPQGNPSLIYLTPSHQFPLGTNMPLARRLDMIEFAAANDAWIIEDDYDCEFPLGSNLTPAMKGLDSHERIFYIGTFSKVLASYIRVNYLVVPKPLKGPMREASKHFAFEVPLVLQATIADYINEGHFHRHIRRLRSLYAEKKSVLTRTIEEEFYGVGQLHGGETGLHLVIELDRLVDDQRVCQLATNYGMSCWPLSKFCMVREMRGLVLGFGHGKITELIGGISTLAKLVREQMNETPGQTLLNLNH
jgi:GntR family transcriptional regulator/MocR family aminotransferase